ncbi:MAG: hypothetical protein EXQ79_09840 [Acidimicrobiia bacterium]|nr:hypothetical protein [Acidimicrobiia bacterium]
MSSARRAIVSVLALLCVYGALSLLNDPRGTLGTDTGGKLATLRAMDEHQSLDPDLGYWAERYDRDGSLHPLFYTERIGDRWVNVTTLPMLYAAYPLYELGGLRAVLLLPMLGAVLTALAARALARRLGGGDGWWAFWAVGLATPVAIYALDFWEHSLGTGLMLSAVVLLVDMFEDRADWRTGLGAGALFGLAATMRTEALVYAVVIAALAAFTYPSRRKLRSVRDAIGRGAPVAIGLGAVLLANQVLERISLGDGLRAARAGGTAAKAAGDLGVRAREAVTTTIGLSRFDRPLDWFLGGAIVIAIVLVVRAVVRTGDAARRLAAVALAVAGVLYAIRFADGFGFIPGVLTASPLAVAGVALGWSDPRGVRLAIAALAPLPLVWLFQFSGGAGPQWGGRYVLTTGLLLAVVGVVAAMRAGRPAAITVLVLGLAVSACGVAWLSVRSHDVADAMEQLVARNDEAVLSLEAHLLREGGAFYNGDRQWLTATNDHEVDEAVQVLRRAGVHHVAVIRLAGLGSPAALGPFQREGSTRLELLPGVQFTVTSYERT